MIKQAYDAGVLRALTDLGLIKESGAKWLLPANKSKIIKELPKRMSSRDDATRGTAEDIFFRLRSKEKGKELAKDMFREDHDYFRSRIGKGVLNNPADNKYFAEKAEKAEKILENIDRKYKK